MRSFRNQLLLLTIGLAAVSAYPSPQQPGKMNPPPRVDSVAAETAGMETASREMQADAREMEADARDMEADSKDMEADARDMEADARDMEMDAADAEADEAMETEL